MSGKVEMEEGKLAEPAQTAEANSPETATPALPQTTEASDPLRPRTRMIETPPPAEKKEAQKLQPAPAEVKVLRPAAPVRPLARKTAAEEPAVRYPARYPGLERVLGVARRVIPVVQKVLPLLEGNIPLTVANLLAPTLEAPRRPVDLHPLETAVEELHGEHVELQKQVVAQAASLQKLSDQVATLQDQADRNARDREEMAEGLRRLRRRVTWMAWLGFVLLAASLAANGMLLARALGWMR